MGKERRGKLWKAAGGEAQTCPPVWLMRQAGRYLPEYRRARARAGSFWNLCMTPASAAEVTLQPVARFGLDAAILFSDILVVPHALGKQVVFEDGMGPRVDPTTSADELDEDPEHWREKLTPVYESLEEVSARLDSRCDLIGFAGGAWTIAVYMAEAEAAKERRAALLWSYRDPDGFAQLIDRIAACVAAHLCAQIAAGANVVQVFDSWAGGVSEASFRRWVIEPTKSIVVKVRRMHPEAKIIGFPRGATESGYRAYAHETGIDAVSLDTAVSMTWAVEAMTAHTAVQGNLDPVALVAGGEALRKQTEQLREATAGVPYIANLGHGVLPDTPVEHVGDFVAQMRQPR